MGGHNSRETTYDDSRERISRLIRQEIAILQKTSKKDKELIRESRENVRRLQVLEMDISGTTIPQLIGDHMPWNYLTMKDTELQRDIEMGMHNILHARQHDFGEQ
jgi:hypothetical protein